MSFRVFGRFEARVSGFSKRLLTESKTKFEKSLLPASNQQNKHRATKHNIGLTDFLGQGDGREGG